MLLRPRYEVSSTDVGYALYQEQEQKQAKKESQEQLVQMPPYNVPHSVLSGTGPGYGATDVWY
eukprot:62817-Rhodomonas_salina.1